jgi:hypothetical protein
MHDAPRHQRRIAPGTISFYARKAHRLRAEAYREMMFGLWDWIATLAKRRSSKL